MFKRLYYILIATIFSIVGFFILSSLQFSDRFAEGLSFPFPDNAFAQSSPQIMLQEHGKPAGGTSTASWPFSTWQSSAPSPTYGAPPNITEDKYLFLPHLSLT